MSEHPHLDRVIAEACKLGPARVAVTYPCSASSIEAALMAERLGLMAPILVGPRARIEGVAKEKALDLSKIDIVATSEDPADAAAASVSLCYDGRAQLIVKGSLHSDVLLAAALGRDGGLRTGVARAMRSYSTCRIIPSRC